MRTIEELQSEYEFLHILPCGIQAFHYSLTDLDLCVIEYYLNPTVNNKIKLITANIAAVIIKFSESFLPAIEKLNKTFDGFNSINQHNKNAPTTQ